MFVARYSKKRSSGALESTALALRAWTFPMRHGGCRAAARTPPTERLRSRSSLWRAKQLPGRNSLKSCWVDLRCRFCVSRRDELNGEYASSRPGSAPAVSRMHFFGFGKDANDGDVGSKRVSPPPPSLSASRAIRTSFCVAQIRRPVRTRLTSFGADATRADAASEATLLCLDQKAPKAAIASGASYSPRPIRKYWVWEPTALHLSVHVLVLPSL
jgi:hypothetical protein